ncbi:MAG TPA: hypothetical protein VK891_17100 [Euzebyales bacterium]|nr:hypothetical protein [Euzebyales bacterium]
MPDHGLDDIELPELTPFSGALEKDGDYDALDLDGLDLAGQSGQRARLTQSWVHSCDLDDVDLRDALLAECLFDTVHAGTLHLAGSTWRDVQLEGVRIGSFQAYDGAMTRVLARDARLDVVNLRAAELTDVHFERCVIGDLDLGAARARRLTFAGCRIERLHTFHADLDRVDVSGAEVGAFNDAGDLRGVAVSPVQLAALAPAMAEHLGITVREDI